VQDENERVVINSPETVAAVEFMTKLFKQSMTDEVFSWNAASNNQGLIAGKLSYILNSISAWRTAQGANPDVANDVSFVPALRGPKDARAAQHVLYNWIIPKHANGIDAAKEFLLYYTENFAAATWASKLYDFPAYDERVPQPVRGQAGRQAGLPQGRHQVEHQHRLPGAVQHRHRRGVRDLPDPQHVRQGGPGRGHPQAGRRPGRGPDQAHLREVAGPRPGRRHVIGGRT
jgi:ABC-type glycerol-3-phosphate transport system substrate-binding protein